MVCTWFWKNIRFCKKCLWKFERNDTTYLEEEKIYKETDVCHICKIKGFKEWDINEKKVRDHCHLTGMRFKI